MEKYIQNITIDRIEENTVIAFTDNGKVVTFPKELADVHENNICKAVFNELGELIHVQVLKKATQQRKNSLKSRLRKLFYK